MGLKSGGTELKFEIFRIFAYVMYIVSGFTVAGKGCAAGQTGSTQDLIFAMFHRHKQLADSEIVVKLRDRLWNQLATISSFDKFFNISTS